MSTNSTCPRPTENHTPGARPVRGGAPGRVSRRPHWGPRPARTALRKSRRLCRPCWQGQEDGLGATEIQTFYLIIHTLRATIRTIKKKKKETALVFKLWCWVFACLFFFYILPIRCGNFTSAEIYCMMKMYSLWSSTENQGQGGLLQFSFIFLILLFIVGKKKL